MAGTGKLPPIIKCPKCLKEFNSRFTKCPSCGYALTSKDFADLIHEQQQSRPTMLSTNKSAEQTMNTVMLIDCPVCHGKIASTVKTCPHCGYVITEDIAIRAVKDTKSAKRFATIFMIVLILVVGYFFHSCTSEKEKTESTYDSRIEEIKREAAETPEQRAAREKQEIERENESRRLAAYRTATDYVRQQLKSPSTAKFPSITDANITWTPDGRLYTIFSYVDSQNSFGAMLRTQWFAKLQYLDNGNWSVLDFDFLKQD